MDYSLAKQLKDSGFPQKGEMWFFKVPYEKGQYERLRICEVIDEDGTQFSPRKVDVLCPTLEELIEACRELRNGYFCLNNYMEIYQAGMSGNLAKEDEPITWENSYKIEVFGKTPTEAVAKLWLKLNE